MRPRSKRAFAVVLLGICLAAGRPGEGAVSTGSPLEVRVLYDNSGSMYPGYAPPGRGGTPRLASGALFFHQYPEIRGWLADLVARQTILGGEQVSMWAATSDGDFGPDDVRQVHPRAPLAQFDAEAALSRLPGPGSTTYLAESLAAGTRGFEGLVWLITDNIVETRRGEPSRDVESFFRTLRDLPRYRSVHLFKVPFRDPRSGRTAALAVYGIVVSDADVPAPVLAHFDRKFRTGLLPARRRQGSPPAPLFPGREHLKLKNLAIDALELEAAPNLQVDIEGDERGLFKESQTVRLTLRGKIRSYLTQHSVTGGRYTLLASAPFEPEPWARRDFGSEAIGPQVFTLASGTVGDAIPPGGSREIEATLTSRGPIPLTTRGLGAWLRTAAKGAVVNFTGTVRMSFEDVEVKLERERMAGIYGIDRASSIFDFQDVQTIAVEPSLTPVSFALKTSSRRTALLLALAAALALPLGLAAWFGSRRETYEIHVSGAPPSRVALRRLAGHDVVHEGQRLGRLARGLTGAELAPP